jgi:hypothetical protein
LSRSSKRRVDSGHKVGNVVVAVGQQLIPQRNRTESENSYLERTLHLGGRARSVGKFNNTLDMIGYCETRNLKAALAHQRRTGHDPIGLGPPGDPVSTAA